MKLSVFKKELNNAKALNFSLPNGKLVPKHFHITEAGMLAKHFIDCGGTIRTEKKITLQVWVANDLEHRLEPKKLLKILAQSEKLFGEEDLEMEVEYQSDTIGKYGLGYDGENFLLTVQNTNCLASDHCGIPQEKRKVSLSELNEKKEACCTPGGGCC